MQSWGWAGDVPPLCPVTVPGASQRSAELLPRPKSPGWWVPGAKGWTGILYEWHSGQCHWPRAGGGGVLAGIGQATGSPQEGQGHTSQAEGGPHLRTGQRLSACRG